MKHITLGAAALNQTPLDWGGNCARIIEAIHQARAKKVEVLCLPELCLTGYGCEDMFHAPAVAATAWKVLEEIIPHTKEIAVSIGLPLYYEKVLFNVAAFVVNGSIAGLTAKKFLAGDGVHYEPRWFKPWPEQLRAAYQSSHGAIPLGDFIFDLNGVRVGHEICEDAWVANRPGAALASAGVDLILNPSASHFAFGKHEIRKRLVIDGSRAFGAAYVYANLLGCEAGRIIYDGDCMIASEGALKAIGRRFSFKDVALTIATIDLDRVRLSTTRLGSFKPDLTHAERCVHTSAIAFDHARSLSKPVAASAWEEGGQRKAEEFSRAVALGLFDYVRKSRSKGFVISLSGGADSSAASVLCRLALRLSCDEIGLENVLKKLSYWPELMQEASEPALFRRFLTCVYQKTRNSSQSTEEAARELTKAIGARFLLFDVDPFVESYVDLVGKATEHQFNWENDDLALQNVQARVRSPGVWLVANYLGALLLTTSNRSEMAVGYATMDGDTSGGLSPLGGIDKAYLREWLVWIEHNGPKELGAVPALRLVNGQAPTAELRPLEKHQTDEADLMPYAVLDRLERLAIRDKKLPLEVFLEVRDLLASQYSDAQLRAWVERFFILWSATQWKRERYAPSFHLDDENLDPRTWCRFPILSGGFARELRELRAFVVGS